MSRTRVHAMGELEVAPGDEEATPPRARHPRRKLLLGALVGVALIAALRLIITRRGRSAPDARVIGPSQPADALVENSEPMTGTEDYATVDPEGAPVPETATTTRVPR